MRLSIKQIRIDGGTQQRVKIDPAIVEDYAERVAAGDEFPCIDVFFDGKDYWLGDGFYRYHSHVKAGKKFVAANVRKGTQRDAILFSCGANRAHGLRRNPDDKRRSVMTLLQDAEWSQKSDRWIADQAGVSHPFVASIRASIGNVSNAPTRETKDGRQYPATRETTESEPEQDVAHDEAASLRQSSNWNFPNAHTEQSSDDNREATPGEMSDWTPHGTILDQVGGEIPARLVPIFEQAGEYEQLGRDITSIVQRAEALTQANPHFHLQSFHADAGNLKRALKFAKPYAVCTYCLASGQKCNACKGAGWLGKDKYESSPEGKR